MSYNVLADCRAGCTPSTQGSVAQPQTPNGRARAAKQRAPAASVLLRLVDDFLLVTPSRAAAEAVALRMLQGGFLTFIPSRVHSVSVLTIGTHEEVSDPCMSNGDAHIKFFATASCCWISHWSVGV